MRICEECGSTGEGGELEYADGSRKHWRNKAAFVDGKPHSIMCGGRFVDPHAIPPEDEEPPEPDLMGHDYREDIKK